MGHRQLNGIYEFFIKWEGYPENYNTLEPAENLPASMMV